MYTPSVPPPRNENPPRSTHLHSSSTTLTNHENDEQFKTYLAGRHLAYTKIISETHTALQKAQEVLNRNPHDSALRALAEGQIEGLKEILQLLKNSKERNAPDPA